MSGASQALLAAVSAPAVSASHVLAATPVAAVPLDQVFFSELIGTGLLTLLGCGVVANVALSRTLGHNGGWLLVNIGWGFAVLAGVYASYRSGAHINPAVTVGLLASGATSYAPGVDITFASTVTYIVAQLIGAFLGAAVCYLAYKRHFDEHTGADASSPGEDAPAARESSELDYDRHMDRHIDVRDEARERVGAHASSATAADGDPALTRSSASSAAPGSSGRAGAPARASDPSRVDTASAADVSADPPGAGDKLGVFCTGPAIAAPAWNVVTEIIGTFVLVVVVLLFGKTPSGLGPAAVSFLVVGIGASLGGPTGYAINPARDLGPRIAHAVLPIRGKGSSNWAYAWVPVVGPVIGGILAGLVANALS